MLVKVREKKDRKKDDVYLTIIASMGKINVFTGFEKRSCNMK